MNILVIDAQGGGMGKMITSSIKKTFPDVEVTAVGTNSLATSSMLKAGADHVATGENAVIVGCRRADIIVGPIGIAIADSMYGEITPSMAVAVGQSEAQKLLIPLNHCNNQVIGIQDINMSTMITLLMDQIKLLVK